MNWPVVALVVVHLAWGCGCELYTERVRVVDSDPKGGFLIRGNLPIKDGLFQMGELQQQVRLLTGLQHYELVVLSFLNFLTAKETKNRYI
jgi:hypothetical protein